MDTILEILAEIGDFFVDLWVNKIIGKRAKKKEEDEETTDSKE